MKPGRHAEDSSISAFVQEMRVALTERCAVSTPADKRRVEAEMRDIMQRHLGPAAWGAHVGVPRGTPEPVEPCDRKMAAAGQERD